METNTPTLCPSHNRVFTKICTHCSIYLCLNCEDEHREHITKSLAFLAEELSENLRISILPAEKALDKC